MASEKGVVIYGLGRQTSRSPASERTARSVNLPQPPLADPRQANGRAQEDARRSAQRRFTPGAVDAVSIEAWERPLLHDQERDIELKGR